MALNTLELNTMLTLSTAHLSQDTMDLLENPDTELQTISWYPKLLDDENIGWFIYPCLPVDQIHADLPEDLKAILELAKFCNATVICLDCDGPILEDMPSLKTYVHIDRE